MVIKMKYEKVLIQTEEASIVFGDFKGQKDQELFRCPRKLEDTDLRRYVNENNCLLGFESDEHLGGIVIVERVVFFIVKDA